MTQTIPLNYNTLVGMVTSYLQRNDAEFLKQIPNFTAMAENEIAIRIKNIGQLNYVMTTGLSQIVDKPSGFRQALSIRAYNTITGELYYPIARELSVVKQYDSEVTPKPLPQYYADYTYQQWYFSDYNVETAGDVALEVSYYATAATLSESNPTNYFTQYCPQLLFYGILVQATIYLRDDERGRELLQLFEAELNSINTENKTDFNNQAYSRLSPLQEKG